MRVVRKDIDTCILFKGGVGDLASTTFTVALFFVVQRCTSNLISCLPKAILHDSIWY